jgi:transposase
VLRGRPVRYGLQRQLTDLGCHCVVVPPAPIPRRPGDRIKTDAVTPQPWRRCTGLAK